VVEFCVVLTPVIVRNVAGSATNFKQIMVSVFIVMIRTGQEWRIKDLSQLMYPEITTHELHEVINQIKRRTYIDRSCFDSNIDILNLQNGLLNIHTLEFAEHSPDYLSLVQLPIKYDPNAKCPNVLKFLGEIIKPDVFTAIQLCGYCLYKSAKYEKAVMCVGKGDNGKSTFLKLIERLLGIKNVSHVSLQELNGDKFVILFLIL
jgi:putative DNA primase/helicase